MRKKYLSALLFGALLFASAGTFTSCKDYDDDINNLQEQITANADAIKKLQDLVGDGKYVTAVSGDGNTITFTFNDETTTVITVEDGETSQTLTIDPETGELLNNGEPTGIKPATDAEKASIIMGEDGCWQTLQEDGTYKTTGIPVSGVSVTGDEKEGWVLTIVNAEGEKETVKVPSAASLITSITVADNTEDFAINYAEFKKPTTWAGKATLPADKSVIFVSNEIDVRINPVSAPATEVDYYLTNAKNVNLSNVVLKAESTDIGDDLTIGDANSRAAYSGNGLYTLAMERAILTPDAGKDFITELGKVGYKDGDSRNDAVAYAVDANKSARSAYSVAVKYADAAELSSIQIKNQKDTENPTNTSFTATVGTTYTITEGTDQNDLMLDMYFEISKTDKETYGVEYDDLNRTFKVTKNPDTSTPASGFNLTVHALDINGNITTYTYAIKLSTEVTSDVTYDAITVDLSKKFAGNNNNNEIISLDKMVEALGSNWAQWANTVDLTATTATLYTDAACTKDAIAINNDKLTFAQIDKDGVTTDSADDIANVKLTINKGTTTDIKLDTQYYLQVVFNTGSSSKVNSIIVPVTFTAPSVADLLAIKSGYVDATTGSIFAYYDDATSRSLALSKYFDKFITDAKYELKKDDAIYQVGSTKYTSFMLATIDEDKKISLNKGTATDDDAYILSDDTNREYGYGKQLTVNVSKDDYEGWAYKDDSKKNDSFTITILSPIFEGKIASTTGTSINVIANNEDGFPITADMISLTDYANNKYNVVPDTEVPTGETLKNEEDNDADVWSSAQIQNVYVTKDANNTYISKITLRAVEKTDGKVTQEGAIMVFGDVTVSDSVDTKMTVNVVDTWGYVTSQDVNVTIVKNNQ